MDVDEIRKAVHRQPFRPIAVRLSDGTKLPVRHPDFVGISKDTVFIGQPDGSWELVDPAHVVSIRRNGRVSHA